MFTIKKSNNSTISYNTCNREVILIDATDVVVGRLSAYVAQILRGKHKPIFSPNANLGDFVIIINAEKVKFTSNKENTKEYFRHTGFPGGIKSLTPRQLRARGKSRDILIKAIEGMLPNGPLGRVVLKNLRVYNGDSHDHANLKPKIINFQELKRQNIA